MIKNNKLENAIGLYMDGIQDGNPEFAIYKYAAPQYIQHSTAVPDGIEGFIEFFNDFKRRYKKREIRIIRSFVDGPFVFLHVHQNLNDGEVQYVCMDVWRTNEDDKLVEHWDVITQFSDKSPSGHSLIDGSTEFKDFDRTEENQSLVRKMITEALMPGNTPDAIGRFISNKTFVQHSHRHKDGLKAFQELLAFPNRTLSYIDLSFVIGSGNFVASLSKVNWVNDTIDQHYAQMDLFRIDQGRIIEHWDCYEPIRPKSEWVNSGKF